MRILKSLLTLLFFISLASPVNASTDEIIVSDTIVSNIEIDGINYTYTQYSTDTSNFTLVDNGVQVDVFEYNIQTSILSMNNVQIGSTKFISPFSRAASCTIPLISGLRDEQGNIAIYEGCSTFTFSAGSATQYVLGAASALTLIAATKIKDGLLKFLGVNVLPLILNHIVSTARQQYRSKYTMLDPYSGTYKYKRLYNSYLYIVNFKIDGPSVSGWFF